MKHYCCQTLSSSGRILEVFHENFFDALHQCMNRAENIDSISAKVFNFAKDPELQNPIIVARTIK